MGNFVSDHSFDLVTDCNHSHQFRELYAPINLGILAFIKTCPLCHQVYITTLIKLYIVVFM